MKKNSGLSRRKIIFISLISLSILIIFFALFFINYNDSGKFQEYLNNGQYSNAIKTFNRHEEECSDVLATFLNNIIADYNNSTYTYEETILIITQMTEAGFSGNLISSCSEQITNLNISKEYYHKAETSLNENNLEDALNFYSLVIESDINYGDAQSKIQLINENISLYIQADELYQNNQYSKSYEIYQSIITAGVNTETAETKISIMDEVESSWQSEFANTDEQKSTYPYQAACKDDILYIPYSYNNIHSIVKYDTEDKAAEIFPIAQMAGSFIISDINVVGDYLYFIAGENVGSGKMTETPYNIYRMKNDGTNLERVAEGDYKNLIAFSEGFYASSYTQGLLKFDREFNICEQISPELPVQMQLVSGLLYFTVDAHDPYRAANLQLVYDGNQSSEIFQKTRLRFAFYDDIELYTYRAGDFYYEKLFIVNQEENLNYMLKFENFRDFYGMLENNILYSKEEIKGQVSYYSMGIESCEGLDVTDKLPDGILSLEKICFENEFIIFSSTNGFIITDSEFNYVDEITLTDNHVYSENIDYEYDFAGKNHFTEGEVVIVEDGYWYYSNSQYIIQIEERYMYNMDTNIYVAHIITNTTDFMNIDSPYDDTHITKIRKYPTDLAKQFSAVFACSGDFFDQNPWTGISIRDGVVYKDELLKDMIAIYPDGSLICYSAEDNITCDDLVSAGVKDTLSFGPILLSGGDYGNDLYTNFLSHPNPRNGIGMVEPGHYVVILSDGRQPASAGLSLKSMADLFKAEGCTEAYNLDGGQSATMMFMGEFVNTHLNDYEGIFFRALPEILYFGTSDLVPEE